MASPPCDVEASGEAAAAVMRAYARERSRFETMKAGERREYSPPKSYNGREALAVDGDEDAVVSAGRASVWARLARVMVTARVDPVLFMAAQFEALHMNARAPEPPQFVKKVGNSDEMTAASASRYKRARKDKSREILQALPIQRAIARARIAARQVAGESKGDSYAAAIVGTDLELSPLFRYALAISIGGSRFEDLAARYVAQASVQYERYRPYYRKHWADFLPGDFDATSRAVYDHLYSEVVDDEEDD